MRHGGVWNGLTDEQRREILDKFIMTSHIPSNVAWVDINYGTRHAIYYSNALVKYGATK